MSAPDRIALAFHSLSCVLKPTSRCWIARKRVLRQVQHELKLENIEPVQSRVEEFPSEPPFDGVISRAFCLLNDMVAGATIFLVSKAVSTRASANAGR